MKRCPKLCCLFALAAMGTHLPGQAALFCVNNEPALHAALITAASNGQNDHIKMVKDAYRSSTGFSYSSSEPHSLDLTGGWDPGCLLRTDFPALSSLTDDGGNARLLDIESGDGAILIEGLRFILGSPSNVTRGGGLRVRTGSGDISIDRNIFGSNTAASNGAVYASSDHGDIRARNNSIIENTQLSGAAIALVALDGNIYASGNTVYGNISSIGDNVSAGLSVTVNAADASKIAYISNNVLWNNRANGNPDFEAFGAHYRYNNAVFWTAGDPPTGGGDDIWEDPRLCLPSPASTCGFAYTPMNDSPLLNAGVNFPFGGSLSLDVLGNPRMVGPRVDVGAVENVDACFTNGFE